MTRACGWEKISSSLHLLMIVVLGLKEQRKFGKVL
jgi:hypothetical protein